MKNKNHKWGIAAIIVGLAMIALGKTANAEEPASETQTKTFAYKHPLSGHTRYIHYPPQTEADYQIGWCYDEGGVWEYPLPATSERGFLRADCIFSADDDSGKWFATEFDFDGKWAESVTQALTYSYAWRKKGYRRVKPAVVLIHKKGQSDREYATHVRNAKFAFAGLNPQNRGIVICMNTLGDPIDCPK